MDLSCLAEERAIVYIEGGDAFFIFLYIRDAHLFSPFFKTGDGSLSYPFSLVSHSFLKAGKTENRPLSCAAISCPKITQAAFPSYYTLI